MTINVGQDFKTRWLKAPEAVRQAFLDDLNRISDLLKPETDIQTWIDQDHRASQVAQLNIEQAYADEKARLIEEARVRRQLALEKSLAEKRAAQQAYNQLLLQDEREQYQRQTQALQQLQQVIDQEIQSYTEQYKKILKPKISFVQKEQTSGSGVNPDLDTVKLRLELEVENLIDEVVSVFKSKLQAAAQEEIALLLKSSE